MMWQSVGARLSSHAGCILEGRDVRWKNRVGKVVHSHVRLESPDVITEIQNCENILVVCACREGPGGDV